MKFLRDLVWLELRRRLPRELHIWSSRLQLRIGRLGWAEVTFAAHACLLGVGNRSAGYGVEVRRWWICFLLLGSVQRFDDVHQGSGDVHLRNVVKDLADTPGYSTTCLFTRVGGRVVWDSNIQRSHCVLTEQDSYK